MKYEKTYNNPGLHHLVWSVITGWHQTIVEVHQILPSLAREIEEFPRLFLNSPGRVFHLRRSKLYPWSPWSETHQARSAAANASEHHHGLFQVFHALVNSSKCLQISGGKGLSFIGVKFVIVT